MTIGTLENVLLDLPKVVDSPHLFSACLTFTIRKCLLVMAIVRRPAAGGPSVNYNTRRGIMALVEKSPKGVNDVFLE